LAAGQSAAFSIPRAADETPERVVLTSAGGHLQIAEPPPPFPPALPRGELKKLEMANTRSWQSAVMDFGIFAGTVPARYARTALGV
jgi:hypothetical protein